MRSRKLNIDSSSLRIAKTTFDVHYYRWAQKEAQSEVNENFATLRTIKNPLVYRVLEMAQPMDRRQQLCFLNALVKRAHLTAVEAVGEALSTSDEELINQYLTHDTYVEHGTRIVDGTFERRANQKIYQPIEQRAGLPQIDKERLRKLVIEKLRPNLGEWAVHESADSWWYETKLDMWSIWTLVATNKRHAHLTYCHRISVTQGVDLRFPISVMQWLGIGGSTDWILWNDSEAAAAAEGMSLLVNRFLHAAPMLLAGVPKVSVLS